MYRGSPITNVREPGHPGLKDLQKPRHPKELSPLHCEGGNQSNTDLLLVQSNVPSTD